MKPKMFLKVFNFVDPLLLYYIVIYVVSKIYELVFNTESLWQELWNKIQNTFGKKNISNITKDNQKLFQFRQ